MSNKKRVVGFVSSIMLLVAFGATASSTKGSVKFNFHHSLFVGGVQVGPGECRVNWERHSPDASVRFIAGGKVTEVRGKFVERDEKSVATSVLTKPDANGRDVIKEIRFQGKKTVLQIE